MARALKCDICGEYFSLPKNNGEDNRIVIANTCGGVTYKANKSFDCCSDCVKAIKEVIESRKPKEE